MSLCHQPPLIPHQRLWINKHWVTITARWQGCEAEKKSPSLFWRTVKSLDWENSEGIHKLLGWMMQQMKLWLQPTQFIWMAESDWIISLGRVGTSDSDWGEIQTFDKINGHLHKLKVKCYTGNWLFLFHLNVLNSLIKICKDTKLSGLFW